MAAGAFYTCAGSRRTLIWRLTVQRLLNISSGGGNSWTMSECRPASLLLPAVVYRYRAVCDADLHGPGCMEFCRPRDDRFGHYSCDVTGRKLCHGGWTGTFCHMRTMFALCLIYPPINRSQINLAPCRSLFAKITKPTYIYETI